MTREHADSASGRAATTLQTGRWIIRAALCAFFVEPCCYRLTAAMAEKLGYVSAPGHDGLERYEAREIAQSTPLVSALPARCAALPQSYLRVDCDCFAFGPDVDRLCSNRGHERLGCGGFRDQKFAEHCDLWTIGCLWQT
jgi:hypothetical protein